MFWERPNYGDAKWPLEAWHDAVRKVKWKTPQDVKSTFRNASICENNRVVFNIGGNKYRLVVVVQYQAEIVLIKFVGTHEEYDKVKVGEVNDY